MVEQAVTNQNDNPTILSEHLNLTVQKAPSADDPTVEFAVQKIVEKELEQRVMVERTIQKFRPRWGIWTIGFGAATFAAIAANSSFFYPDTGDRERLFLNLTSLLTATMAFTQLKPVEDPISTGETKLMRKSGSEVVVDTLKSASFVPEERFRLQIMYGDSMIVEEANIEGSNGVLSLNLASLLSSTVPKIDGKSRLSVKAKYQESTLEEIYSVHEFMKPYVVVNETVVLLRNAPVISELNVVGEVGSGSTFQLIENSNNGWYRVLFGGSEVFVQENQASIEWLSDATSESIDVFEFSDVPFGDIDVENSVPILRQHRSSDRSLIITNNFLNPDDERPYVERDHRLFDFYMEAALQMESDQRKSVQIDPTKNWKADLDSFTEVDSTDLLYVYFSGIAEVLDNELNMVQEDSRGEQQLHISDLFRYLEQMNPETLIVLADFEYRQPVGVVETSDFGSSGELALQRAASRLQSMVPNSAIIFSNRPGQKSQLFAGAGAENKRHHIFTYYWAEALKKRNTTVNELLKYLENNVDYTSRRLHDTPQEITAFGNLTISVQE